MQEAGFELTLPDETEATFFPFASGAMGAKEMKLIDRCTAMPLEEFADALGDPSQRGRGPIVLAMIALSIRAKFPEWSVERIMRIVDELELPNVTFLAGDEEEEQQDPLAVNGTADSPNQTSSSPSGESSPSAIPAGPSPSETSKPTQA